MLRYSATWWLTDYFRNAMHEDMIFVSAIIYAINKMKRFDNNFYFLFFKKAYEN